MDVAEETSKHPSRFSDAATKCSLVMLIVLFSAAARLQTTPKLLDLSICQPHGLLHSTGPFQSCQEGLHQHLHNFKRSADRARRRSMSGIYNPTCQGLRTPKLLQTRRTRLQCQIPAASTGSWEAGVTTCTGGVWYKAHTCNKSCNSALQRFLLLLGLSSSCPVEAWWCPSVTE